MRQKKQIFRVLQALTLSTLNCRPWTSEELIKSPVFSATAIASVCGLAGHVSGLAGAKILGIDGLSRIYLEKESVSFKTWFSYNAIVLLSQSLVCLIAYYSSFSKNFGSQLYVVPLVLGLQYLNPALLSFKYGLNSLDLKSDSLAIFADCIIASITFVVLISIIQLSQLWASELHEVKDSTSQVIPAVSEVMQDLQTEQRRKESDERRKHQQDRHHREEDRDHRRRRDRGVSFAPEQGLEGDFIKPTRSLRAGTGRPKREDVPPVEEDVMPSRSAGAVLPPLSLYESGASSSSELPTPNRPLLNEGIALPEVPVSPSMIGRETVAQVRSAAPKAAKSGLKNGTDKGSRAPKIRK